MLGKTNAVYAETSETSELSLKVESILTDTTESIWKIEHINNIFFVFLDNNRVLYGEDIKSLQYLKKEEEFINATHVIYAEQTYFFVYNNKTEEPKFEIYKTQDLKGFTTCTIQMSEQYTFTHPMGIFLSSNKKIVILFGAGLVNRNNSYNDYDIFLGVFDAINDSIENMMAYMKTGLSASLVDKFSYRSTRIFKDRLFIPSEDSGYTAAINDTIMSLSGEYKENAKVNNTFFVGDVVIYTNWVGANKWSIYCSQNCYDYKYLGLSYSTNNKFLNIVPVNENYIGIFYSNKFAFAESCNDIIDAFESAIDENEIIGDIVCSCPVGEYTYLGCSGGIIYKIFVDFSGNSNSPQVSTLKTLSAKQALAESKSYTDKRIAELELKMNELLNGDLDMKEIQDLLANFKNVQTTIEAQVKLAEQHANDAADSASAANVFKTEAADFSVNAADSASASAASESAAKISEINAKASEDSAASSANNALDSENRASMSADNASVSADLAGSSAETAEAAAQIAAETAESLSSVAYYKGTDDGGTIDGDLTKYNVTSSMTLKELFSAIPNQSAWDIYFNSHNNTLNNCMPVTTGGILHIYKNTGSRGMMYFFDYRTGNIYTTPVIDGTDFKWSLVGGDSTHPTNLSTYNHPSQIDRSYTWENFDISKMPYPAALCAVINSDDRASASASGIIPVNEVGTLVIFAPATRASAMFISGNTKATYFAVTNNIATEKLSWALSTTEVEGYFNDTSTSVEK